jgi:hypothetical protein
VRVRLKLDVELRASEDRQFIELRAGRRPRTLILTAGKTGRGPVTLVLSPAALRAAELLEPLEPTVAAGPERGAQPRRQSSLALLRRLLDEPLGELDAAATAATRQPGVTLRAQLSAWVQGG